MNKLLIVYFVIFSINTIAAAERGSRPKLDYTAAGTALNAAESILGLTVATAMFSKMTGTSEECAAQMIQAKNALNKVKGSESHKDFITQVIADYDKNERCVGCLKLYVEAFSQYLNTHKREPDTVWFNDNLPKFVLKSKELQRDKELQRQQKTI